MRGQRPWASHLTAWGLRGGRVGSAILRTSTSWDVTEGQATDATRALTGQRNKTRVQLPEEPQFTEAGGPGNPPRSPLMKPHFGLGESFIKRVIITENSVPAQSCPGPPKPLLA